MELSSEALYALKPVTFRYKKEFDPQGILQFGLVAEDVEAVNPDLVVRDKEGKSYSVRYDQVNAMLLNEFIKEHGRNAQQEATIAELKSALSKQEAAIANRQQRSVAASCSRARRGEHRTAEQTLAQTPLQQNQAAYGGLETAAP